jgi:hypothetical protein
MTDSSDLPLWHFISSSAHGVPSEPPTEKVRANLMALFRRLRQGTTAFTSKQALEEPEAIEQDVEEIAPWPDWVESGADALDRALEDWSAAPDNEAGCRVVIAPPFNRLKAIFTAWNKRRPNYRLIEPPTITQIMQNPHSWLDGLPLESKQRFVLVALEHCYLRHHNGLTLVRRLIEMLWQHKLPCVIGCDSWAWTYLDFACQAGLLDTDPLTLAPLDANALSRWISVTEPPQASRIYRRTDKGVQVHPIHEQDASQNKNPPANDNSTSEFLVHVAAHSRGIPGVAWALWRRSLLLDKNDIEQEARRAAQDDDIGKTIWVNKWEKVALPAIPPLLSDTGAFALHAILLHSGLRFEDINYLSPGRPSQLAQDIQMLQAAGIIENQQDRLYVTALGYPTARRFLQEEGFMVDIL